MTASGAAAAASRTGAPAAGPPWAPSRLLHLQRGRVRGKEDGGGGINSTPLVSFLSRDLQGRIS